MSQYHIDRQLSMDNHVKEYQHNPRFDEQLERLQKEFFIPLTASSGSSATPSMASHIDRHSHLQRIFQGAPGAIPTTGAQQVQQQQQQQLQQQPAELDFQQPQYLHQQQQQPFQYQQPQQPFQQRLQQHQSVPDPMDYYNQGSQSLQGQQGQQQQQIQLQQQMSQQQQEQEAAFERTATSSNQRVQVTTPFQSAFNNPQRTTQRHNNQEIMSMASPLAIASHQLMLQQQSNGSNSGASGSANGAPVDADHTRYAELFDSAKQKRLEAAATASGQQQGTDPTQRGSQAPLRGAPTDMWTLRAQTLKNINTHSNYANAVATSGIAMTVAPAPTAQQNMQGAMSGSVLFLNNASAQEHQRKYREQQEKQKQSRVGWKSYSDYRNAT